MIFYALDCETTGLEPETDRLLELAVFNPTMRRQCLSSLVYQSSPIPTMAKSVTLIDDDQVRDAPREEVVIGHMVNRLQEGMAQTGQDFAFVCHNAAFDRSFVVQAGSNPQLPEDYSQFLDTTPWVCTLRLARHLLPGLESYTLQYLRFALDLKIAPQGYPHRARYDAEVCWHVWQTLRERLAAHVDPEDARAVVEWQNRPVLLRTCVFGKHRGESWDQIPRQYLQWMQKQERESPGSWDSDTLYTISYYISGG